VRLLQVNISEFRSIADQQFTAEGLVVLFGPNLAGKTSVLEVVEQLITGGDPPGGPHPAPSSLSHPHFTNRHVLLPLPGIATPRLLPLEVV
jgi:hypothetical protein